MSKQRIITALWMDRCERRLLVEDALPEGGYSVTDLDHGPGELFYRVHEDGTVSDDRGDGDWFGVVTDWGTT